MRRWVRSGLGLVCVLAACLIASGAQAQSSAALDRIRQQGKLVIGTDATYPPFEFMEKEKIVGFDVDLGNEIGRELGVPVEWVNFEWAGIFGALETGKCDLIMSCVVMTPERKAVRAFSRPYLLSGQTLVRRKNDDRIKSVDDVLRLKIAVQTETTGQFAVEKRGVKRESIRRFDTLQDALQDVQNNASDVVIGDLPALREMIRKGYPGLETVGGIFTREHYGVVARKTDPVLVSAINAALERIMVDGRYAAMHQRWFQEPATLGFLSDLHQARSEGTPVPEYKPTTAVAGPGDAAPAGDTMGNSWGVVVAALPQLGRAALTTLEITLISLAIGIPLGLLIALARLSHFPPLSGAALVYAETMRGTPLLMQIYVIYFVLPGFGISLPQFVAAVAALSLNAAAYISETFRGGIQSIDAGQMEAAKSLGMDYRQSMRWVILPQTLRRVLPPLTNEAVALLKDSSLVSVIALSELTRVGKELATVAGNPGAVYLAMALFYLAMTLPLTYLVRWLEARWHPSSRNERPVAATTAPQPA